MAWLSTVDDVTLIAIFEHFANCYVSMPIVGTCRRIFITWTRKRRQIALEESARLISLLDEEERRAVRRFAWSGDARGLRLGGGNVPIYVISNAVCEIRDLMSCCRVWVWTRKRRQIALEESARLISLLDEEEIRAVRRFAWSGDSRGLRLGGGNVPIYVVSNALCEIRDLIR